MKPLLTSALLLLALTACAPGFTVFARDPSVTVDNRACLTTATVFIDGQNVGTIPGGGVRSFGVPRGQHTFNVDNDLAFEETVNVTGDLTWRGGTCL
ncbi:hypothetical protein [Deinococcus pimensis]|uniref:hypothetical protein n=1 Tax=Deinococcus pimensis TaxID=309888 RepID=UPI0004819E7F|nr:hypothetical protein [Deinococcus pimensis]